MTPTLYGRLGKDQGYKWTRIEFSKNGRAIDNPDATSYFLKGTFPGLSKNGKPLRVIPAGDDFQRALDLLRQYQNNPDIASGNPVQEQARPITEPGTEKTLEQAIEEYIGSLITKKPDTARQYRSTLQHALKFYGPRFVLSSFDRAVVLKFRDSLYKHVISETTRHDRLNLLCMLLRYNKIYGDGPKGSLLFKGDWPKPNKKKVVAYTEDEIHAMLRKANTKERLLIETFLYSGARDMEVAHLVKNDVEIVKIKKEEMAFVNIRAKDDWSTKSKEDRRIRVDVGYAKRMLAYMENKPDNALLFPNGKGGIDQNLLDIVKEVAKTAEVKKAWLHKFRATYATFKSRKGADQVSIQANLGHKDSKTTQRYLEPLRAESKAEGENTDAAFGEFANGNEN